MQSTPTLPHKGAKLTDESTLRVCSLLCSDV